MTVHAVVITFGIVFGLWHAFKAWSDEPHVSFTGLIFWSLIIWLALGYLLALLFFGIKQALSFLGAG